jgi:radical SAM superfamily enzyme YgiQ (UPF0313 family)
LSVIVLDHIEYYKIGKTLKLNYDFINRLYEGNQNAYDQSYNLDQEIESIDHYTFDHNNYDRIDPNELNYLLRKIRYNIYPNDSNTIVKDSDLKKLDLLIYITENKKQREELI